MKTGTVFNIQKFCIHDGDGIRTCVFLKGCPLRCIWCHNPESLEKTPSLSFDRQKCSLCGRCLLVCSGRLIENGSLKLDRAMKLNDQLQIKLKCLVATGRLEEAKALAEYILSLAKKIFVPDTKQLQDIQAVINNL